MADNQGLTFLNWDTPYVWGGWGGSTAYDLIDKRINRPGAVFPEYDYASRYGAPSGTGSNQLRRFATKPPQSPVGYMWNLPPHSWSLPTTPTKVDTVDGGRGAVVRQSYAATNASANANRRGRLWAWSWFTEQPAQVINKKCGFQFLWNPATYGHATSVNVEVTPSVEDYFLVTGAFPGQQTLNITLRIDRTNDFACFELNRQNNDADLNLAQAVNVEAVKRYYRSAGLYSTASSSQLSQMIRELSTNGTNADIDYIYKVINGDGWTSMAGKKTADIGFLQISLVRLDIGPASYIGYIQNVSVNHIAFNQNMIPIRSDVSLQMNMMSSSTADDFGQIVTPAAPNNSNNATLGRRLGGG
jgi:hypothetical protein